MRVFQISERRFMLQLEHGEEVKEKLRGFAEDYEIGAGVFRGLGAAERGDLDFYGLPRKQHSGIIVEEATEVACLLGNITRNEDGKAIVHVHATLSRPDGSMTGGHVERLFVGATLEIDLEVLPGTLWRQFDQRVGLHLQHTFE